MKKVFSKLMLVALAALAFTACEDVPEPYVIPSKNANNQGQNGGLPYESVNLNSGWSLLAVTNEQPWSLGSSYVQATGYQIWDNSDKKSNRAVEGWLISPTVNTTDADSVKISFEQTIRYTNNVSGWEGYHKIYASNNYDGTNFDTATWMPVAFTPVASPYNDWTLYSSGEIQLPQEMAGKENVHVAFWFKAPATASTTWELKNFKMEKGQAKATEAPIEETIGSADAPITVAEALTQVNALQDGAKSSMKAYVKGKVVKVTTNQANFEQYGNITYYISDDGSNNNSIQVYAGDGLNGEKFTSVSDIAAGDEVVVLGTLYKYVNKNTGDVVPEIEGSFIVKMTKGSGGDTPSGEAKGKGTLEDPYNSVAANAAATALGSGNTSSQEYYIKGKVVSIATDKNGNVQNFDYGTFGNASFYISDDGTEADKFYCYRVLYLGNKKWEQGAGDLLKVGDEVIVCGKLTNYNGTPETAQNAAYLYSLNGKTEGSEGGGGGQGEGGGDTPATGTGSYSEPYSISAVIANGTSTTVNGVYVKGYIVGWIEGQVLASGAHFDGESSIKTNILVADNAAETDVNKCIPVQLPNGAVRTGLNIQDNPQFYGKQVLLYGNLEKYFGAPGVKSVTYAECDGQQFGTKP